MQTASPVLDMQLQMIEVYKDMTREKMRMITAALAVRGKMQRNNGYDPLAGALTQLAIVSRKLNPHDLDIKSLKLAIDSANDRWWEWYDCLPVHIKRMVTVTNHTPRRAEREQTREDLRRKYGIGEGMVTA